MNRNHHPRAVIVAWDAGMSGREVEYADYKAQRPPRPDLLSEQWPHLAPLAEAFGFANVKVEGWEADDVIATLVRKARDAGIRVMIVSGDRDVYQLVRDGVRVMTTSRGVTDTKVYDAEGVVERYGVSREEQDAFGLQSQRRWAAAHEAGRFADELAPVGEAERDEHPRPDTTESKLAALKPAFRKDGTVTAGNAAGINDGAAAVVIASEEKAKALGAQPLGSFLSAGVAGVDPRVMGIGPIPAVRKALARGGVEISELDLVELNEAFASQSLVVIRELGLDPEKVNVNGGAIALGHPLGMTGARLVVTLLHELRRRGGRYGLATMCVGVGQGQAALFERPAP